MSLRLDWGRWGSGLAALPIAAGIGLLAGLEPLLAIAASFALAFTLLVFADLAGGVALFSLITFMELVPAGGPIVSVTKGAGLILALAWLGRVLLRQEDTKEFATEHPLITAALAALLAWATASFAWAEDTGQTLTSASRLGLNMVLMLIVFTAARTPRQALVIAGGFVAGSAVAAAYGLLTPPTEEEFGRLSTGSLDPNQLAAVLCAGGALALGVTASLGRYPLLRLASFAVSGFCVVAICLTASRGGLIALGIALGAALILGRGWRPQIAVAGAIVAVSAYFAFVAFASDEAKERIADTSQGQAKTLEGRTTIWAVGWSTFEDNAAKGVGAGNFGVASRHYLLESGVLGRSDQILDAPPVAHNSYLEVATELGVVGIALFLLVLVFCVSSALLASRRFLSRGDRGMAALSLALAIALIGTLAANFFISELYSNQLWLMLGLAAALRSIAGEPTEEQGSS